MKAKGTRLVLIAVSACVLIFLASGVSFAAFEFADGRFYITGWLEILTSLGLQNGPIVPGYRRNEKWSFHTFRNTLQIETTVKLTPNVNFFFLGRGYFEGTYDFGQLDTSPERRAAEPTGNYSMKKFFDAREYLITANVGHLTFRVGRQQVVWGEADAIRIADIINPLDFSWHYMFESWDDIRIPLRMINIVYNPPSQYALRFQLIYIPEDFRPNLFAPAGAVWAIPQVPQIVWDQEHHEFPEKYSLDNGQVGERIRAVVRGVEMSLFHFYHRADSAVYTFDPRHLPLPLHFQWPYMNTVGGTFNFFERFTSTVFRGEMAVTLDQPFTSTLLDRIIKRNTLAFMLGFDRPTMLTWLNREKAFFISGQWYHKQIFNHDPNITDPVMANHRSQDIFSLLVNTEFWHSRIVPQFLGVWDIRGNGFLQPSIKYSPNQHWDVTLAANFIIADKETEGYWGPINRSDEVYLRVRYKF
jgi:hypothetical protein